ncbi:hypothetical protein GCM10010233_61470 [Streptomyces pseudogriseolus]|nr:hypothetical protein GCM10010233_61470 [Streptomyces gancidicus]
MRTGATIAATRTVAVPAPATTVTPLGTPATGGAAGAARGRRPRVSIDTTNTRCPHTGVACPRPPYDETGHPFHRVHKPASGDLFDGRLPRTTSARDRNGDR